MIPLINHDSQWGRSEVVIIYPDLMIPFDWSSSDGDFTINKGDITNQRHTEWLAERMICAIIPTKWGPLDS